MNAQEVQHISPDSLPPDIPKMTLEEFLESDLERYEYFNGELVYRQPKSIELGGICTNVVVSLGLFVREKQIGRIYMPPTTFKVGEHALVPDVAFLSTANLPDKSLNASPIPPDLVGEVVSPTDASSSVEEKAFAYLEAGTKLVWVLKPRSKTVTIYRSETDITTLSRNDTLSGEKVVEGFSCQVAELFE